MHVANLQLIKWTADRILGKVALPLNLSGLKKKKAQAGQDGRLQMICSKYSTIILIQSKTMGDGFSDFHPFP